MSVGLRCNRLNIGLHGVHKLSLINILGFLAKIDNASSLLRILPDFLLEQFILRRVPPNNFYHRPKIYLGYLGD